MALDRTKFTMKSTGLDVARTWPEKDHPLQVGDSVEGKYVEKLENIGINESNVYVLEVDGERVGVWGSTVIDENMKEVALGSIVGFEFAGMRTNKRGIEYKNFIVGVADGERETPAESAGGADEIPF